MKLTSLINLFQFDQLLSSGITLEHIYFLEMTDDLKRVDKLPMSDLTLQELLVMGYIDDNQDITLEGKNLLKEVYDKSRKKTAPKKKKEYDPRFLEWWESYPRDPEWGEYIDSRTLRVNKSNCQELFLKLLKRYTTEELINGLKYEIAHRKEESRLKKENIMMYMQSTEPYLNQFDEKAIKYVEKAKKGMYKPKVNKENIVTQTRVAF